VRHLWRMSFAMFIATGSFFLGQAKLLPRPYRIMPLLAVPPLLPLALLAYWPARLALATGAVGGLTRPPRPPPRPPPPPPPRRPRRRGAALPDLARRRTILVLQRLRVQRRGRGRRSHRHVRRLDARRRAPSRFRTRPRARRGRQRSRRCAAPCAAAADRPDPR